MGACFRVIYSDLGEARDGGWGVNCTILIEVATVAVVRVFTQADIARDIE
jgi:hypothetical protein